MVLLGVGLSSLASYRSVMLETGVLKLSCANAGPQCTLHLQQPAMDADVWRGSDGVSPFLSLVPQTLLSRQAAKTSKRDVAYRSALWRNFISGDALWDAVNSLYVFRDLKIWDVFACRFSQIPDFGSLWWLSYVATTMSFAYVSGSCHTIEGEEGKWEGRNAHCLLISTIVCKYEARGGGFQGQRPSIGWSPLGQDSSMNPSLMSLVVEHTCCSALH